MKAADVYAGSDGDLTKAYYAELQKRGPIGLVAMNLFRAQKCSARAKVYRGGLRGVGSYKSMAYERKSWSMGLLCEVLAKHGTQLAIVYGWKEDPETPFGERASWVLYVELPFLTNCVSEMSAGALESGGPQERIWRQVSFHSPTRGVGPDYNGEWDGKHVSAERILEFCDRVMQESAVLA